MKDETFALFVALFICYLAITATAHDTTPQATHTHEAAK